MSYDPNRERKQRKQFIQESIIKFIVIMIVALILAAEFGYRGDLRGIMDHISEDVRLPRKGSILPIPAIFSIFPFYKDSLIRFIAIGAMGWFIWFVIDWLNYSLKRNMRPGEEHGSASFNLDYSQVEHDYIMSPKILKDGKREEIFYKILGEGGYRNVKQARN